MTEPADRPVPQKSAALRRLDRLVRRAQITHLWEVFWRGIIPALVVAGLFLCLSWLGVWLELPGFARLAGVGLFAVALAASLVGLRHCRLLTRQEALKRIDAASGLGHRPAGVLDDTLANAGHDPGTQALWALHRRRAEQAARSLRVGAPSPRAVESDRFALRAGILVALIACAFVAGPERYARTIAAFDWGLGGGAGPNYRLDAWIDPPAYTGKPPVLLDLATDAARDEAHPLKIEAPAGSAVIIRASGGPVDVETSGALVPPPKEAKPSDAKAAPVQTPHAAGDTERRFILHGDSRLTLRHEGSLRGAFSLVAIADKPPTIMLREVPKSNARGSLTLAYTVSDDYGVSKAEAVFSNPKIDGEPAPGPSLVDPPQIALSVPSTQSGAGDGETTGDLSDHPWAGTRVTMVLVAHDEGGNEGRSDPVEITLPQKPFVNPLARALVEQRRDLVLDPGHRARVLSALEALMIAPEAFKTTASVYLGLSFAASSLAKAETKPELVAVADFLWGMALQIENGDLSDAERALRDAEKALRDAIDRKAPDEEIKKLTDNLQAAMDKFLAELSRQQAKDDQTADAPQSKASRTISQKELQALIDRLRQASRSGDRAEAGKALEELQNLLENLKAAKRQKPDPRTRAMAQALNELDQMTRDQQSLRDDTYKDGQDGDDAMAPRPPSRGQKQGSQARRSPSPGQQGEPSDDDESQQESQDGQPGSRPGAPGQQAQGDALQKRQQDLRDRLDAVRKRLKQAGQGQQGLDQADKAMQEAEEALKEGQGSRGDAVDAQGRALEGMRKGAQKLAEALQKGENGEGQAEGDKEGQGAQGSREGQQTGDADPLGRPRGGNPFNANSRYDPMGLPAAQRAQRVLEELRRRLSDPNRSREETDYLERLLQSY